MNVCLLSPEFLFGPRSRFIDPNPADLAIAGPTEFTMERQIKRRLTSSACPYRPTSFLDRYAARIANIGPTGLLCRQRQYGRL
jgi:hypothetical protein